MSNLPDVVAVSNEEIYIDGNRIRGVVDFNAQLQYREITIVIRTESIIIGTPSINPVPIMLKPKSRSQAARSVLPEQQYPEQGSE